MSWMIDPIFRTETNRGLQPQPQMAARRIRNVQAMMTVTEGILSSASLPSETFEAHPISQCHHLRPQRDSTLDLNYLSNPRQVRPCGATSTRAHCRRSVSERKYNLMGMRRRLIPIAQMRRNGVPEVDTPF